MGRSPVFGVTRGEVSGERERGGWDSLEGGPLFANSNHD